VRRKQQPEGPRPLGRNAAERLGEIVEAAERAAASVIDDAEAEAQRYLTEAKIEADRIVGERLEAVAELSDSLIARAEEIRRHSEALIADLEEARRRLAPEAPADEAARRQRSRGSHLSAVAPVAAPRLGEDAPRRAAPAEPDGRDGTPAGARLLATQMAVSGSSREEIELRLRNGFEIEDTAAILDAILGPEE
jgi:hypothetical protein